VLISEEILCGHILLCETYIDGGMGSLILHCVHLCLSNILYYYYY